MILPVLILAFAIIAIMTGIGTACYLDVRRSEREAKERENEQAIKVLVDINDRAEQILVGSGLEGTSRDRSWGLERLSLDALIPVFSMMLDLALADRTNRSALRGRLDQAITALKQIQSDSAVVGYDSGHSGINALCTKVLSEIT